MTDTGLLALQRGLGYRSLVLLLPLGCGGAEPPTDGAGTDGAGGIGDGSSGPTVPATGDDEWGDDAADSTDLGAADDDVGPPPACQEDPPTPFEIPTDPSCMTEPQVGAFSPVIEWTNTSGSTRRRR